MFNRRFYILPILLCTGLSAVLPVEAASRSGTRIDPSDLKHIMLVKDIKPGMKGYGKTVFKGTKVETFQVEVLGVMEKVNFGKHLILVKLTGGPMTDRGANLIQGMSGSPVFINGKIIGAFAYGEIFLKEPIGMVTPIEDMLDAWDPALPTEPSTFFPFSTANLDKPIPLGGHVFDQLAIDFGSAEQEFSADTLVFQPLATPIMIRGMSPRIMSWLKNSFKPFNLHPIASPGLPRDKADLDIDLQPGAAVGVSLVTGDLDITAIGTVTYRRGNKLLAFGHPLFAGFFMNGLGPMDAAMTTAYVHDVLPSMLVSSKIASPVKPVGRVFQDRPWSIGGEIGKLPNMIPVSVNIDDKSLGRKRNFNVQVINHPFLASDLIVGATAEAIFEMRGSPNDATAKVRMEILADEVGTIVRENTYFDPVSIDLRSIRDLEQLLNLLRFNKFYPVGVKKVKLEIEILPKHQTAQIQRIFLKEGKFEPGDTVEVGVVLRPFKQEPITKTLKLDLPKNMPNGRMSLQVRGGMRRPGLPAPQAAGPAAPGPQMPTGLRPGAAIENIQQLIKKFLEREKNNDLVARIILPKPAISIAGEKLSGLPPTIAEAMKSSKTTMLGSERDDIKEVVATDWVIFGAQNLRITVEKKDKGEKKPPTKREPAPPSGGPPDIEGPPGRDETELGRNNFGFISNGSVEPAEQLDGELGLITSISAGPAKNNDAGKPKPTGSPEESDDQLAEDAKKPAKPDKEDEKPVGRRPSVWKQTTRTEFLAGTSKNVSPTTGELLTLAASLEPLHESAETYFWRLLPDGNGNLYVGTGNHGIIYKVAADGTASVFHDSPELEVHSLAKDAAGNIYAGTSPNGIVYKIAPDGSAKTLLDPDEKYVVALALDSKGNLYAAVGDKCKVYKVAPDGEVVSVLDSSESHALSLAVDEDDNVYVGTGVNGIIYKISAGGRTSILYDAAENSISALTLDKDGDLFAGTSPKGVVYKLARDATPKALYDKAGRGIVGISTDDAGNVYAMNASSVFKLMPDETVCTLNNDRDLQFLSLALGDGKLYAGTGNVGSLYSAEIRNTAEGTYESPVHDCRRVSKWGTVNWLADLPEGSSVTLQTRTGDVGEPDSTWSGWSYPYSSPGAKVTSPPGRYIQYLATLKAEDAAAGPKLKEVSIVYLPKNQAPKVTLTSPKGGEKWSKSKTIKWTGSDGDKDTLTYEVFYSSDGGATWHALSDKVKPATESNMEKIPEEEPVEEEDTSEDVTFAFEDVDPQEMLDQMATELAKHPEIPQEMKEKMTEEAQKSMRSIDELLANETPDEDEQEPSAKPSRNGTKQTSFKWDTTKYPDGTYLIKVVGSDALGNPTDPLTDEEISEPLIVSNKSPKVAAFKKTMTVQADKTARLEGVAYHELVEIAGVQYKVGSDDWAAAAATDGIFDSLIEPFAITTQPLTSGEHTVEVKAIDEAGNSATTKLTVKVE